MRGRRVRIRGWCAVLAVMVAPAAWAGEVVMTNGDRLTGTVLRLEGSALSLKTGYAGELKIDWPEVERLTSRGLLHVTTAAGVLAGRVNVSAATLEITAPGEAARQIPRTEVLALRSAEEQARYEQSQQPPPRPGLLDNWFAAADVGFSAARGNTHTSTLSANVNAARATPRDRAAFYYSQLRGRERTTGASVTSANIARGGGRYDRLFTPRVFVFGFGDFEFDELQQLDLRSVYGGGLGVALRRTPRTRFDLFTGASFNREDFASGDLRRSGEALGGQEFGHKFNGKLNFNQRLVSYFNLTDTGEYRVNFDSSLGGRLNSWLGWHFTLSNRYVSNPAATAQNNDLLVATGLRFNFGTTREFTADTRAPDLIRRR